MARGPGFQLSWLWLAAWIVAALVTLTACGGGGDEREPIVFSDLNWSSSEIQSRIAAFIVEHGYGYSTELIAGDSVSLQQGLANNDTDVTMEVWLPNQVDLWREALADEIVVDVGSSLDDNWEAIVIPQYVKDANPGLVSVADLPEYIELFETADSRGQARLVGCLAGWACERVIHEKLAGYGIADAVHVVDPGSEAALFADLYSAYDRGEAWLGYMWGPTRPTAELDLYVLEEPPFSEACWAADKACAWPITNVRIYVHRTMIERAPEVIEFLGKWSFPAAFQVAAEKWMLANNETPDGAAIWYLQTQREQWASFVPAEVAEKIDDALEALDR